MISAVLISIIRISISLFNLLLIGRMLLSFRPLDEGHPLYQWIMTVTEPVLEPVRRFLEERFSLPGFFDWSFLVVLLLADLCESLLIMIIRILL